MLAVPPIPIPPEQTRPAIIRTWDAALSTSTTFITFDKKATGGGFLASGDVDGDGANDIIVGAGKGSEPYVFVFSSDGTIKVSFLAYPTSTKGGVRVAVGDIDADGKADIVTAPGPGVEPQVKIFSGEGLPKAGDGVLVYNKGFKGGVRVAVGDIDADGKADIVTAPGPGGGPDIRIWNGKLENIGPNFFAYDSNMTDGVTIAFLKTPQGPAIVTAPESWTAPLIRRYSVRPWFQMTKEFFALTTSSHSGLNVSAFDSDGDGYDEIAVSPNGGLAPDVSFFDIYGTKIKTVSLIDAKYRGALSLASLASGGMTQLISMPTAPVTTGPTIYDMFIDVNITLQRLTAYEHGRIARSFLVSTGIARFPTPLVKTMVLKKIPIMDYRWSYGPGNPNNYFLPKVKYNLNIYKHIYIHYAYWHNNFGRRMSHGCVNTGLKDAEWIYNWATTGTHVETHL